MDLEVGEVVLCTVDRIVGAIVFVKIQGYGEGSIILSEIAPGRIRNLRDYVVPKKKIVCKVLRILGNRIDLSLRRVTPKEKKEVMEQYKLEKSYKNILKSVLGEKTKEVIKEIESQERLYDFLQEAKQDSKKLEKIITKENSQKILNILNAQKQKIVVIKKEINLSTIEPNGLTIIKNIFKDIKNVEVNYISAGKYSLKAQADNPKTADNKLKEVINNLEKESKKYQIEFSVKEK